MGGQFVYEREVDVEAVHGVRSAGKPLDAPQVEGEFYLAHVFGFGLVGLLPQQRVKLQHVVARLVAFHRLVFGGRRVVDVRGVLAVVEGGVHL